MLPLSEVGDFGQRVGFCSLSAGSTNYVKIRRDSTGDSIPISAIQPALRGGISVCW